MNVHKRIQKERMLILVDYLNKCSEEYYNNNNSIISDKEFDDLIDELLHLETVLEITLSNSPTQNVGYEVKSNLKKETLKLEMLSLDKTKSTSELIQFSKGLPCILSWKMDGLSILLHYKNGQLYKAFTRGNGKIGEDITHNVKMFDNVPLVIPRNDKDYFVKGEAIITYDVFNKINEKMRKLGKDEYKNPRNLASGSVRQLDNKIAKERHIKFYAWRPDDTKYKYVFEGLKDLKSMGFDLAELFTFEGDYDREHIDDMVEVLRDRAKDKGIPIDGLVLTYDDIQYGKSLGSTNKFPRHSIAYKFYDEVYETVVTDIEWTLGKTGVITPTVVFKPVEIDGTSVSKASVYNVSCLTELDLNVGDTITVYKANQIIPCVSENLSANERESTYIKIPSKCPVCGGKAEIVQENDAKVLMCMNDDCDGKVLKKLCQFVSKEGMNIDGLSKQTLSFLLDKCWIESYIDLYKLEHYGSFIAKWKQCDGFGDRSVDKILKAIRESSNVTLDRLLYAVCIPNVGVKVARDIAKFCDYDITKFIKLLDTPSQFKNNIDGVGDTVVKSLRNFKKSDNWNDFHDLCQYYLTINKPETSSNADKLKGLNFVITGSVNKFDNRKALEKLIDDLGGKCSGSVSAKTSYLINNDKESSSSKNKKAQSLGIPIISEDDFLDMIK